MKYFNEAMECLSKEDKKKLQSQRLVEVVKRVYDNVPTYRQKMDDIGLKPEDIKGIEDITKLPFTTKQDLRNNYPYGMFAAPMKDIVRIHASSGTTGKLTVVGYTQKDIDMWAECCARSLVAAGADQNSIVQVCYGYGLFTGGLGLHYGAEKLGAVALPASSGNTARQLQLLQDFNSEVLCCTPSYAIYLAEAMKKEGIDPKTINLKYGIFGAEPWSYEMRKQIEEMLDIRAHDIYGLSEIAGPGVAFECEYQTGCHIQDDFFYPEIIDKDTLEALPYGETGELVLTTLTKEGIPLIRYRTRDITALSDEACPCGRTGVRIMRVTGRDDDMLIIRGVNVFPSQIESALVSTNLVEPYYHITVDRVNNLDIMEIAVEMKKDLVIDEVKDVENIRKTIASAVNSAIGITANIKLVSAGTLARVEGKAAHVTDNRKY